MIAFGCATTSEEEYLAYALPSIERCAEPDSHILRRHGRESIHEAYNEMLVEAAELEGLEAIVLLHQDVSLDDENCLTKIRGLLSASESVAVIGVEGARHVRGLAWWEGEQYGASHSPLLVPGGSRIRHSRGDHEVDAVDGALLVLSPWAARELRFDRELAGALDGYDIDLCLQARARGRRVVCADLAVSHYIRYDGFFDRRRWVEAAVALQRKWALDPMPRPFL